MFRFLTFLCSVLIVALIVVAFVRGWVTFSVFNKENSNQTGAAVTIDKTKIKDDVAVVKEKVHMTSKPADGSADGKSADGSADGKQKTRVHGTVKEIGTSEVILTTDANRSVDLKVARETEIRVGGEKATLQSLRQGDSVTATYITLDNRRVATSLQKD
jgi:hypothetical protein